MNIIYRDNKQVAYIMHSSKKYYINEYCQKVYNIHQIIDMTGFTKYKILSTCDLYNINPLLIKNGKRKLKVYEHVKLKNIKANIKNYKNKVKVKAKKVPYLKTTFHQFASKTFMPSL